MGWPGSFERSGDICLSCLRWFFVVCWVEFGSVVKVRQKGMLKIIRFNKMKNNIIAAE